ncbi:carbohydrate ABC transporter permease [Chengkuizengella sediminis]|uniref:carbohydrate ABC transporter permease n=1 Tax=Chengkuizengella sediminis TaxID=1885917 RepID=UPI00138A2DD1|nr:carbohydrate ABC transporter permease [Chengkuizengella sediminis]NDI35934.1 carbohydrate ABC transporter permease [Chengkuizengella sediminis]
MTKKANNSSLTLTNGYTPYGLKGISNVILSIMMAVFSFICLFPFIYVIIISFTAEESLIRNGFQIIPDAWSLEGYKYLWKSQGQILRSIGVTLFITVFGTLLSVVMISLFGYAISRKEFKYRRFFTFLAFFTMLFGGGLVPTYIVVTQFLGLRDNVLALILPLVVQAFWIIIMRTFFIRSVPEAVIESARIDGASEIKIFMKIVMPLSLPAIATIALFSTLTYWNDWFQALLYITDPDLYPLQALLSKIESNIEFLKEMKLISGLQAGIAIPEDSAKMAMVVISTLPIALSYPFFQKYFVEGLTVGSVKE